MRDKKDNQRKVSRLEEMWDPDRYPSFMPHYTDLEVSELIRWAREFQQAKTSHLSSK